MSRLHLLTPFDSIPANAERMVYAVLTPDSAIYRLHGKLQHVDARISITLAEFDAEVAEVKELGGAKPVREVSVTAKVCQSIMSLAQKNFNYGSVEKKEALTRTIVISNLSQVPLAYRINKAPTLASYDITFNANRHGVIRPYRSREVELIFKPSIVGPVDEKLLIENVHDATSTQTVRLKANVRAPNVFYVTTTQLHFGFCVLDQKSRVEKLLIMNASRQRRQLELIADTSS